MSYVKPDVPNIDRIADRVAFTDSGCWLWIGSVERYGYGRVTVRGERWLAHRFVYTALVGPIAEGLSLDHLCRNTLCVNPDHLEPVDHAENVRRGMSPPQVVRRSGICKRGHRRTPSNVFASSGNCKSCRRGEPADIDIEDI